MRKVDLPPPETPVTAVNRPSGMSTVMFLRLLARAPLTVSRRPRVGLRRSLGAAICLKPVRYCPVRLFGLAITSSGVPSATTSPPCTPAPGPMSTTWSAVRIASSSCSTTSTRVAHVAQRLERVEQPRIVALMQPDRRLVQHIEHAGQARADLRGEPDALALAARQRAGGAGEREIIEADIVEEGEPLLDLLQDARGDLVLLGRELRRQRLEPAQPPAGSTSR